MTTDFSDFIASSRAAIEEKRAQLSLELAELNAEMAAIDAYEQAKRSRRAPSPVKGNSGRYPQPGDGTLSIEEAGREFLGLSESGSWLAWRRGEIPSYKIGRFRRVPIAEMQRKMAERQRQQAAE